jgi:N utilization substance protein B
VSGKITRRQAREAALQVLFQFDFHPEVDVELCKQYLSERLKFPKLEQFALELVLGVRKNLEAIDGMINAASEHWEVSRMAALDRNAIRLAVFEFKFFDTPPKVAMNEVIELAKKYSGAESASFVNGVLDRIAGLKSETNTGIKESDE